MQDNEKKPALRFKGFTDPWEQRKLTNLCEKFTDGDWIEAKDQSDSGVRLVQTGNVGVTEYLDKPNNKKWISFETFEQLHCEEVYPGDILISRLPEPAGRACIMPNLGTKMITAVDCTIVRPNAVTSTRFLLQYLSSQAYFDAVNTCLAGGTRQRISRGNLAQFNVPIPSSKIEQEKIGEVLEKLDTLITLHQRKYEKLVNIKKSMLDKMFPKNGASVPEIRFKGFTDLWEQRKISELAEKTYGGGTPTTSNEAFWNGNIPWIQSSDIVDGKLMGVEPRKYITQTGLNSSATQLVPKDSIAIITRVGVGKLAYMPFSYSTSQDFLSLSKLNTEPFFTVYACYKKLQSELNTVQGTSIKGITKDELLAKTISVPVYSEQKQIGSFFTQLDTLITLHQRKLEKLQNIKKSCLEKMFV